MDWTKELKEVNHESPRLKKWLKRYSRQSWRVYAIGELGETYKSLMNKRFRDLDLNIGYSTKAHGRNRGQGGCFTGQRVSTITCNDNSRFDEWHPGNRKMIDVTERFVQEYSKYGMCALHGSRHEMESKSKKIGRASCRERV